MVPLLLFGFYRKDIYDYYLGIMFPYPFLVIGVVIAELGRTRILRPLLFVFILWLFVFNLDGRPMKYPPNDQLGQVRRIAETAFRETGAEPFNFALITGGNSDHAYRYFFEIWGKPPVTIENEAADPDRTSVTDQLIVICEIGDCQPLGHPLWEIAGFGRAEIVGSWEVPYVRIFKLRHYEE
jgi:hypothetical protein